LAINWVSLHIDGITNARRIAQKAEVDMEMVRACLRVLKHHGVIALVDMFYYSNRYEPTTKAASLLAGKDNQLLREAVDFCIRHRQPHTSPHFGTSVEASPPLQSISPMLTDTSRQSSNHPLGTSPFATSLHTEGHIHSFRLASIAASHVSTEVPNILPNQWQRGREDSQDLRRGVVEFYCHCSRHLSVGEVWVSLMQSSTTPLQGNADASNNRWSHAAAPSLPSQTWRKLFHMLDHRRLVLFGVVHGFIRRIHRFPMRIQAASVASSANTSGDVSLVESDVSIPPLVLDPSWTDERSSHPSVTLVHNNNNKSSNKNRPRQDLPRDQVHKLRRIVEPLMDGQHCDDEIACLGDRSLDDLLDMLFPNEQIVSVYSSMPSG
jgi:Nitrogen permease regulator 2